MNATTAFHHARSNAKAAILHAIHHVTLNATETVIIIVMVHAMGAIHAMGHAITVTHAIQHVKQLVIHARYAIHHATQYAIPNAIV